MMIRKVLLFLPFLLFVASAPPVHAAPSAPPTTPLQGPLVAADTAAQDEIVLYDLGTGTQRELTFGTGWHRIWDFSPDGCRILFTMSDGSQPANIYTARLDASDVTQLVTSDGTSGAWEPQWGGDRIAYTQIDADGNHYIAWINPTTRETGTYSVTGDEHNARWSLDHQRLVYISYEERPAGADMFATAEPTRAGATAGTISTMLREADLWVVNADGSGKFRLTNFPVGSATMPRWSPDGDLVGFVYSPAPNNDQFWMIGAAPDAVPTQLSYQWALALDLTWLPDSTAMIASARDLQRIAENRLWRIPLTGNADQNAVQYLSDPALSYADYARFSADGQWLALRSEYALAVYHTTQFTWQWIGGAGNAGAPLGNTPPVWSPAAFPGEAACA
jgi:Tol biopolymer transport system component